MALLKVYVVLSVIVITFACDLRETQEEIDNKKALQEYIDEHRASINPRYRLLYHIAPPVGWMNDPNGFSFFNGNYHLFYQFHPYDTKTGNISWGHVTSKDLVEWKQEPTALLAGPEQCFSGSAIEKDGTLILMYTAHQNVSGVVNETQYLAFSNDGVVFNKYKNNPVISFSPDNSADFRDPKVWYHEGYYYVVLGSKTKDDRGKVLLYRSADMGYWEYKNVLGVSTGNMGNMWECPDFFELNGTHILLMSPQGMNATEDRYQNKFQTGYIIGNFDYNTNTFTETTAFQEIDYGHDFYATQTMEREGKRYLIAWMGMWEADFEEANDGWAGAMTIVRELTLHENRILMKPLDAIKNLRDPTAVHNGNLESDGIINGLNKTGELIVNFNKSLDMKLDIKGSNDDTLITLTWDAATEKVALDRKTVVRQGKWEPVSSTSWRIFLDSSSIEVFCGEGEVVFSSRAYPDGTWVVTNLSTQVLDIEAYKLNRSVPE